MNGHSRPKTKAQAMKKKTNVSPLEKLESCPPFLCYALARKVRGSVISHPTLEELTAASGISARTFARLCQRTSWDGFKFSTMKAFIRACNIDPFRMSRQKRFLRAHMGSLPHLNKRQMRLFIQHCEKAGS